MSSKVYVFAENGIRLGLGGGGGGGRGGGTWVNVYVPLATQHPYPFIVYFMTNYRPHLSHFWVNVILATPT